MIENKIDKYLNEQEDDNDDLYGQQEENELAQKVGLLATIMDKKKEAPMMKKVVAKAMIGKSLSANEREILMNIMSHFFKPEKGKFRQLMGKF